MTLEEIARLLHNLIRVGTVIDVDCDAPAVRVSAGELETNWLRWLEPRAGQTTDWDPPTVGEQVVLLSPGGELSGAIVLRGLHSDLIPHPSKDPNKTVREYPDGARVEYDHASSGMLITGIKTLTVDASDSILLKAGSSVTLDTPEAISTGKHNIKGLLSYLAGLAGFGGDNGSVISGSLRQQGGELSSNGVVLDGHKHDGVQSGGSTTGGPVK